jgi:membrane protein involved in colicin uptake
MVSRRLAGFTPDLKSEMSAIDGLRDEIRTAQSALRDQAKANETERERIRKERERMAEQASEQQKRASAASSAAGAQAAPKAQENASGGTP